MIILLNREHSSRFFVKFDYLSIAKLEEYFDDINGLAVHHRMHRDEVICEH